MALFYLICIALVIIFVILIISYTQNPFKYPYFSKTIDVSGKRNPDINDAIDLYINENGFGEIARHEVFTRQWKARCRSKAEQSIFRNHRLKQLQRCLDDNKAYCFVLVRVSKYGEVKSYVRYSVGYSWLYYRNIELSKINYEATLNAYNAKDQRKLMTKELREIVMKRDNYTCQICGKYMPDGVGLQIDHIIPVAKGGKTVLSNLQVLCSKCNGRKSDKIY